MSSKAEDAVAAEWKVGDVILDLYEVKGLLGEGGMGKVYKVHHKGWNVDLAVKSPRPDILAKANGKDNFVREAETWINLELHPHTVSCYYVRTLGGIPRVFAEYVAGGSLSDWIRSRKLYEGGPKESLERILDIAIQFAWGLHYAHEEGLVHQDVKPANVMMTADGIAKVTDFGLAQARASAGESSQQGERGRSLVAVGAGLMTREYASSEQAAGRPLTRKTDIWSWGASLLEMYAGELFWSWGPGVEESLDSYLENWDEASRLPRMPEEIIELMRRCFKENPENRPEDMLEIAAVLQEVYQQITGRSYHRESPKAAETLADSLNNRALSMFDLAVGENEEKADKLRKQAEFFWEQALQTDPLHPETTYNSGVLLECQGKVVHDMLVKHLNMARTCHSKRWEATYLLALVYMERGDIESAVAQLEELARQAPKNIDVGTALKLAQSGEVGSYRSLLSFKNPNCRPNLRESSIGLSRDGSIAVSGTLGVWDVNTGRCLWTFEKHGSAVSSVSLSADSSLVLSGSYDKTLRLWEIATGRCVQIFEGHLDKVNSVCLSADGRLALSGSKDKTLRLWEVTSGCCLRSFIGHNSSVISVSLSDDGCWALSGSNDLSLKLWEVATGRCLWTFVEKYPNHALFLSVCLSADGRFALAGSSDNKLRLLDVATGCCLRTFEGHTERVISVYLSRDGRYALSGSYDVTLKLWDVATGRCLRTFIGHTGPVHSVCMSAEGRLALSESWDNTLRLWKLPPSNICLPRLSRPWSYEESSQISAKARELVRRAQLAIEETQFPSALSLLQEARDIRGFEHAPQSLEAWTKLSLFCSRSGLRGAWLARTFEGHTDQVKAVCLSADGRFALSGGGGWNEQEDTTMRLWDVTTGRCLRIFKGHVSAVTSVFLSRNEDFALSGSWDQRLGIWEIGTGRCLKFLEGHGSSVNSISLSTDGRFVLSGGGDVVDRRAVPSGSAISKEESALRLWEVTTGRCLRTFEGHKATVTSICLGPDGRYALSGSLDQTLRLWDVATGHCIRIFNGHKGGVSAICLSADGRFALSGSDDGELWLWEIATGQCLRAFERFSDYGTIVTSICLSNDGKFALTGHIGWHKTHYELDDHTMRLWEVASGRCLYNFKGHTDYITSISLSHNGRYLLSGSEDNTLRLWELDWELDIRDPTDWNDGARPFLEIFLTLHTPYSQKLPEDREPSEEEIQYALTKQGKPSWSEQDFQGLIKQLQHAGYGWLRPEGVRRELEKMAAEWNSPPPLPDA